MGAVTPTSDARTRDPAWVALGQAVVNRRVELGMRTREAFAANAEISTKILGEIERGDRTSYDPATLAAVEQSLQWPPGEVRRILRGDGGRDLFLAHGDGTATAVEAKSGPTITSRSVEPPLSTLLWLTGPRTPLRPADRDALLALLTVLADRFTPGGPSGQRPTSQ